MDTNKVTNAESIGIRYQGSSLKPRTAKDVSCISLGSRKIQAIRTIRYKGQENGKSVFIFPAGKYSVSIQQ
ncbi:hypothetical protein [Sphingobacterium griseoflavum]|uniref:hypothetical protein n=1 Tax=Sphingobacterium griseoflavum TaxID=1474952 RepID=UPI003642435B